MAKIEIDRLFPKKRKSSSPLESTEQELVFVWARANQIKHPALQLLNGSLNGVRLTMGLRVKAKRQGMPKGYPDIFLPVGIGGFYGLFVELKRVEGGVVSPDQERWLKRLNAEGFRAVVARGHEEAIETIKNYLGV